MPKFAGVRIRGPHIVRALFSLIFVWLIIVNTALADQNRREPVKIVYCEYMPFFFKAGNGEPRGIFVLDILSLYTWLVAACKFLL